MFDFPRRRAERGASKDADTMAFERHR